MNSPKLVQSLERLSGHLVIDSPQQKEAIQRLSEFLSRSLLQDEVHPVKGSSFTFEDADLFSPETIPDGLSTSLQTILQAQASGIEADFRVFGREVPVRSTQLQASVPLWAGGAAVERTIGPLTRKDGRQIWFDFFRIERLVALYIQGQSNPALLFKVNAGVRRVNNRLPLITDPLTSYSLVGGSIWINSAIFSASSPQGYYSGLTIRGGTIKLNAAPQLINGQLTISPNTVVTVQLQLQQPGVIGADATSPYGIDARNASLQLPQTFAFRFSGTQSLIGEVGEAQWNVYGHTADFRWNNEQQPIYDNLLHRVLIPMVCSTPDFTVRDCQSPFYQVRGSAAIASSHWALPAAPIDILNPTSAAGIGALVVKGNPGLTTDWQGLKGGSINLVQPYILAEPGRIAISDLAAGNGVCQQKLNLWKDAQNPFGSTIQLQYSQAAPFFYNTFANGSEAIAILCNADIQIDRPVTAAGQALQIRSKNSLLMLAVTKLFKLVYLFDDNIFFDNIQIKPLKLPDAIALALNNALFKTTPVNGCVLFGLLADDFIKVKQAALFLTFGIYAYLPTLPDPYAANLGGLRFQFRGTQTNFAGASAVGGQVWLWLVCFINWKPAPTADAPDFDAVTVSFYFAPLQNQFQIQQANSANTLQNSPLNLTVTTETTASATDSGTLMSFLAVDNRLPDYGAIWDENTQQYQQDVFALLDVSTNADLLGVSFGVFGDRQLAMLTTHRAVETAATTNPAFPLQVRGMDVVSRGNNVRAFTVPQISWEPVFNLTPPKVPGDPNALFNYYPNDGGPTRLLNNSQDSVALAPIPLMDFLVDTFDRDQAFLALALLTLPFGMKALALLKKQYEYGGNPRKGNDFLLNAQSFDPGLKGARQLEITGGIALVEGESDMFIGSTVQINNVLELDGTSKGASTLGRSVTKIFNNEFLLEPTINLFRQRGVPLTRMDLSGYGASIFSDWLNPKATIAATSQAKFDVFVGRCAHEIIQVKSILKPWEIKVVRTITLFRASTGYVYRYDSGWRPESDGLFDSTYYVNVDDPDNPGRLKPEKRTAPYEIHPGVVKGLFNVRDIQETDTIAPLKGKITLAPGEIFTPVDENGKEQPGAPLPDFELQPVFFSADVEVENPVSGYVTKTINGVEKKVCPSKQILGFVQIAPRGVPLSKGTFQTMVAYQGTIGGPLNCVVDIHGSGQQMRMNRFDISNAIAANNTDPIFVAAGRGNVILPKDGSWSMVQHQYGTGEVTPVPPELSVPLIRIGKLVKKTTTVFEGGGFKTIEVLALDQDPATQLARIANPTELLRKSASDTINYGFLLSTDTQKALFLTPSFKQGFDRLLSKTPPLFVDAFRIVSSKGIFPNVGNAETTFGDAVSLVSKGNEFTQNLLQDGGKQVRELMQINNVVGAAKEEGYKLLKQVEDFDLPNTVWKLIEIGGAFAIYIEYKADKIQQKGGGTKNAKGNLDFNVDSFATDLADKWKSRMSNVGIVVDLGPIKRLMTIKGNWDAKKGSEAQYRGSDSDPDLPSAQIEFAPELQPVIDILEILQDLQGENYKDAFQKGLKLAMSNKAGSWEYKFDASKEIPVLRFPPGLLYNDPNAPLKLEAGIRLGAYFNAALKVTTDPKQLLPTAGGYLGFYGRLSVMCVSLSVATVYAVGQVDLQIAADTKTGPSLLMKYGIGAQLVVGLPVVGNVSVLYMVGIEIYVDSVRLNISAFLLFQGHAELLGGIIGVTITIEAKGSISRANDRTDLAAQVTFGLDISIFLVIDISFSTSWQEQRQIA